MNNQIELVGIKNQTINFDNVLQKNQSLYLKKCVNVIIIINSKINKITIDKSSSITINISELIGGFEISYSNDIIISSYNNDSIPSIDIYKSKIYLIGKLSIYVNCNIIASLSEIYQIDKK